MGGLLGLPEWLAITLWLFLALALLRGVGQCILRRAHTRLAAKRPGPTRAAFLSAMAEDVPTRTAAWLWDQLQIYYAPLTPHPDDSLIDDACIDEDDIVMDWPSDFENHLGQGKIEWPHWPEQWPLTVRNYARWLEMGLPDRRIIQ